MAAFDFDEMEEVLVEEEIEVDDTSTGEPAQLIVYNDDHNTFDWVIQCFVEVLGHASSQAEQLALIIHTKGKASVKNGTVKNLRPHKDALTERGLSAVIEEL
ncbi:MAG: ATP-dependent Clp protease adaptor ClpS [Saprospiraceae bacterium]